MFEASESQYGPTQGESQDTQREANGEGGGDGYRQRAYIWGTNVSFTEVRSAFETFFRTFAQPGDQQPLYPELLRYAAGRQDRAVNVDCSNVAAHSAQLYRSLVEYPSHVLPIMDAALNAVLKEAVPDAPLAVQVRPFGLKETRPMRLLGPEDIDRLVAVRGMVVRASGIIPSMRQAFFRCSTCGHGVPVDVDVHDRVAEPTICPKCGVRGSMVLIHNLCTFADKQAVRLQETPESIPQGETPQTVTIFAFDTLVDAAKPGDRVEVTGIFRADPIRSNPYKRSVRSLYRTCLRGLREEWKPIIVSSPLFSLLPSIFQTLMGSISENVNGKDRQVLLKVQVKQVKHRIRNISQRMMTTMWWNHEESRTKPSWLRLHGSQISTNA